MDKKRAIQLLKLSVFLYVAAFLIINWNDISWVFNYQEVYGLVADFFNPYPSIAASSMNAYFYPNHSQAIPVADAETSYTDKQNTIEIPKISISVPIVFATSTVESDLLKDLDQGVVYYPGSVYPGQQGQIVMLGHSAPPGWPKIKHDWVFTDLQDLKPGDSIMIDVNNTQYTYIVKETKVIQRGADVPTLDVVSSKNVLTLISCWPPGKDYQRIAVIAELEENPQTSINR